MTKLEVYRHLGSRIGIALIMTLTTLVVGGGYSSALAQASLQQGDGVFLNNDVPREVRDVTIEQKLGDRIPQELSLTDSNGQTRKTSEFWDGQQPVIVTLNYSNCPMLCNVQLNQLTQSLAKVDLQIAEDFRILTVSIDPKETTETAAKTKEKYISLSREHPRAAEGWTFCTADQSTINQLADSLGFRYTYDAKSGEYYHPAMLAFVSPEGVITRYSLEVGFEPKDLRKAIIEAGDGTVGTPVDQLVLWCFNFDPSSNSYVPQAWKIMRAGGAATVLLMLACLAPFWFGKKRHPSSSVDGQVPLDAMPEGNDSVST